MQKELSGWLAALPIIVLVGAASMSVFVWEAGMLMPLVIGVLASAVVAAVAGFKWAEVQEMMVRGVGRALPAVFILLLIGLIVGSWMASGVIPTIIYYGLSLIHPSVFVPIVALVTGIVSITLGSSFTSIATVGLAFMAIGEGLGFPAGLVGGAVISGAFFGDKLSPLSDTTNIAPAMAETDLFSHIRHMLWDTLPAFGLSIVLYAVVGRMSASAGTADAASIGEIRTGLAGEFTIHPLLLLLPVVTVILMMKKVPAIPALAGVGLLGAVMAVIVQGMPIAAVIQAMTGGFTAETGVPAVDSLLNRGGMTSMLSTIALLVIATALGGILEESGSFEVLTRKMMARVQSAGGLIATTIFSTFVVAFASGAQFLAIVLPSRTFVPKYKEMGIDTVNLSRCVEAAGTVGINLVPWSVPAVFAAGMFGISPGQFIPYAFFVFLVPLINLIFGFTGFTIKKKTYSAEPIVVEMTKEKEAPAWAK
ncbi:Na+/H+ antiporter NhaC [Sporosarcina sp. NCCP-2716]|uniref:Na+/H+ antiporter NhaC n=1 Tax=Sporosarcina sp. NCCP-2716 TaxID=2943679 RepID=UPI00203EFFD7|nr:Na+/H+ antiporter NhaC [Sporosarcina sp. NCCP-2716]GKV67520.1 Na+/H+ antiporter NhaC [Sporosarcina sp. NCCP-2716]